MSSKTKAPVDNVLIRGTETRAHPDKHVVYAIEVATKSRVWTVFRRYNEFVTLHETLAKKYGVKLGLPPKRPFGSMSAQVVESRRQHLEDYLKALVLGRDERVATCKELSTFLESDAEAVRTISTEPVPENWLDQYRNMENLCNSVSVHLASRDKQLQRGEADNNDEGISARKKLVQLNSKISELAAALKTAEADPNSNVSEKELVRRYDMVNKLRADKDRLDGWLKKPQIYDSNARELLGTAGGGEGGGSSSSSSAGGGRGRRVFGQETEETRQLDNEGLLQMQKQNLSMQDSALDQLMSTLARQKAIASEIGNELDTQNKMLDELDDHVESTQGKIKRAHKKMLTIS